MTKRCDIGGNFHYPNLSGPAVYREPCSATPTHRYQSPGMVEGHWQYRCAPHAGWLSSPDLVIEQLSKHEQSA